ncbi:MAG: glycosyltransferase [Planctomycetota bacterium]|nr:glycosyltransferase [Planctomycetota bacterium]
MRVLVVSNGFPPRGKWGTEFYTKELVLGLRSLFHDVAVLIPDRDSDNEAYGLEEVDEDGVPVYLLQSPPSTSKSFETSYTNADVEELFRTVLERWRPDLVHFTYLLWGLSVRMPVIAKDQGIPSIVTVTDYGLLCHRGQMFDWRLQRCFGPHPPAVCARCVREPSIYDGSRARVTAKRAAVRTLARMGGMGIVVTEEELALREKVVREALEAVSHLIAPTRVVADTFRGYGVPEDKLTELVYSFDDTHLREARKETRSGVVTFGFLGQFTPHKGLAKLLAAVEVMEHRLPEAVEPWEVRIYGGKAGGRNLHYTERLFSHDRGPRVRVCPPFAPEDAHKILADLWAVVMPSEWDENAPLTALQARAAGVPVIGSNVPGIAEVIEHGRHGLLFPPGNVEAMANAMREVVLGRMVRVEEPGLPVEMEEHLECIEGIYRSALGRSGRISGHVA